MSLPFQLVRTVTGVPTVANFANMDGTPIVIDDASGNAYTLVAGVVTRINSAIYPTLTSLTNSLAGAVALNNTANYFDGPSVPQGTTGTWLASGTVTITDTAGIATIDAKLWDGTTVIASARVATGGAAFRATIALSGFLASPAGNLKISVRDTTTVNGFITANDTGNAKDSTITAVRIA